MIKRAYKQQKGAALLVFFLILFTVSSTVLLAGFNSNSSRLNENVNIQEELLFAKEALLAYSFSFSDNFNLGPGRLPCRDRLNIDGEPDCASPEVQNGVGRLPTQDSNVPFIFSNQFSGTDKQFWYVVAEDFRSDSSLLNSSTASSLLSLDGDASYVALIIDANEELTAQDRFGNLLLASNYLEGGNEDGTLFVSSSLDDFNDHVIGITKTELMSLAVIKAAQEFKDALNDYYDNDSYQKWRWNGSSWGTPDTYSYPLSGYIWDVPTWSLDEEYEVVGLATTYTNAAVWFTDNSWDLQVNYTFNSYTNATFSFTDCTIIFDLQYGSNLTMNQTDC